MKHIEFEVKRQELDYSNRIIYKIGTPNVKGGVRNELLAAFTNLGLAHYDKLSTYKSILRSSHMHSDITYFVDESEAIDLCEYLNSALLLNSLRGNKLFRASIVLDQLLEKVSELEKQNKLEQELKLISSKIMSKGQFEVFNPLEHGIYDDKYYISHANLGLDHRVTIRMLINSFSKEMKNNLMWKVISYKTIIKQHEFLTIEDDIVFKDKMEAEDFCNYINSIFLINKLGIKEG